ncbi:hypothetical protein CsSME_00050392 [Camellia sinensis var. sinensis]
MYSDPRKMLCAIWKLETLVHALSSQRRGRNWNF